jgi:hypothetical protein
MAKVMYGVRVRVMLRNKVGLRQGLGLGICLVLGRFNVRVRVCVMIWL